MGKNGLIKEEEFWKIPKITQYYDKSLVKVLDISLGNAEIIQNQLINSSGIFDKFKNMASLEEDICYKITGWNKSEFYSFSKLITSVRDTVGRSKDQLIAIYRYWLMKGIDQCTLSMLKCNTSQQQISHYLQQIRTAINIDFVPLFLGANKGKEFFLNHNTTSVKILHDFEQDQLAIVVDGTYTKIEKSSNNQFQYLSYSQQKLDNLVKPFIMCCADGYFIDCYGPFPATLNDANIFRYILNTDDDLKKLCDEKEKIMFFVDRGNKK